MKRVFFFLCAIFLLSPANLVSATTMPDFQASKNWAKLDSSMQQAWLDFQKDKNGDFKLECFVVSKQNISQGDEGFLLNAGFVSQVITGEIARGHMKVKDLQDLANVDFVRKIGMAKKK